MRGQKRQVLKIVDTKVEATQEEVKKKKTNPLSRTRV
jgi:hypothetical protein